MITFMVLGKDSDFKGKLIKLIERKLTELLKIECKILRANRIDEALKKANAIGIDVHVVMALSDSDHVNDYLKEVVKKYLESPVVPVVVIASGVEATDKVKVFNEFKIIGYIDRPYRDETILADLKKAVIFAQMLDNRKVTFKRPGYSQTYYERDIYCVQRLPNGQKKINVTARVAGEMTQEEFSIKSNISEVQLMFENKQTLVRCHQSWLVNPKMIISVDGINDRLILFDEIKVPLGRTYTENLEALI